MIGLSDGATDSLPFSEMRWAAPELGPGEFGRRPEAASDVLGRGDSS